MDSFRQIQEYPDYEINSSGVIRRIDSKRCLAQFNVNGHMKVKLNGRNEYVSRLVAITFIPNPNDHKVVMHKNGNSYDDNVDNLKWATKSETQRSSFDRGIDVPGYKEKAKPVMVCGSNMIFNSVKECSRYYEVSPSFIRYCIKNQKLCKGDELRFL